jgi:MFS family permease
MSFYHRSHLSLLTRKGLAESGYYPGVQYILGSWYRRDELGKRSCIFQICSALGQMVSGYLMAGVFHLGGIGGYKGWQWYEQS